MCRLIIKLEFKPDPDTEIQKLFCEAMRFRDSMKSAHNYTT
jgi:hypothetical protein